MKILLPLFLITAPLLAGTVDEEMGKIRDSYSDFFREFPKADQNTVAQSTVPKSAAFGASKSSPKISGAYYDQVAKSSYAKQQIMQSLSTLAQGLAQTAGSAYAFESAKNASTQAAALSASSDPDFQKMGQLFSQESQQISNNDRSGAENTAAQIQNIPPPYVAPGYQPTQGESVLVQAFNMAVGATLQALGGVLGGQLIGSLLNALGLGSNSGLKSAGYSTGAGLAGSAYNGQSAAPALNGGGAQVIQSGAGAAQNQIYQIPSMQQPTSVKQGSALPGS